MVSLVDIVKAIDDKIKDNFLGIEIQSTDIKEGFERPCFYVQVDDNRANKLNPNSKEKTLTIRIYYFPKDRYENRIELLEIQDILENMFFDGLQVNENFYISTLDNDLTFTVVDGVLQLSFDLYYVQLLDEEDAEPLEELEVNNRLN